MAADGRESTSGGRRPGEASVEELRALSEHAAQRLALAKRRAYVGESDPGHLAELQRVADGAAGRLRRALAR
jgi:hypothetical protein